MNVKFISFILLLILFNSCSVTNEEKANQTEKSEDNNESKTVWNIIENKDEWGDLTGEKSAMCAFEGTFSNSATSEGRLAVGMFVKTERIGENLDTIVGFVLGEYGRNSVRNMDLNGKARNSNGEIIAFPLYIGSDGFSMIFSGVNSERFQFLCKGGNIDVILEEQTEYGVPSKYKFTIPFFVNIKDAVAKINN